jgi:hypothetical protein
MTWLRMQLSLRYTTWGYFEQITGRKSYRRSGASIWKDWKDYIVLRPLSTKVAGRVSDFT